VLPSLVVANRDLDDLGDVRVVDQIHVTSPLLARANDARKLELCQVLAHRGYALADLSSERADISFAVAQQPDDLQACDWRRSARSNEPLPARCSSPTSRPTDLYDSATEDG
jgi:hypothetical protein